MKHFLTTILLCGGLAFGVQAQEFHMPKPSPTISLNQEFSTSYIQLKYSRPAVRGREIFGELIPYGDVWRTGANQATKITFGEDVRVAGQPVKAGSYALFTVPGKNEWKIILNKGVDHWGSAGFNAKENVLEVSVPVIPLENTQESLRISIENLTKNTGKLVIAWADVRVEIPIEADNNERIMAYLAKSLKSENPPYSQAASYYLSTDQKLEDALRYAGIAIKENPEAYYLYWLEARIYQKLGKHKQAVASAKKAAEMAKSHPAFAYEYQQHYLSMLKQTK